jgi:hypothetical protein
MSDDALQDAYDLMQERMVAVGATLDGALLESDAERLMFSGLPGESTAIGWLLQHMADEAIVAVAVEGVPAGPAVKGTLARALLVGYYLAPGARS